MPILLKLDVNYGDEFDCEQFAIIFNATTDEVKTALKKLCTVSEVYDEESEVIVYVESDTPIELYFGTNEFLEGGSVLNGTKITELGVSKAEAIIAALGLDNPNTRNSPYPVFTFGTGVLSGISEYLYVKQ